MTMVMDDSEFPSLYTHKLRADWGVGILAGEIDGKRRYLFENGEERTLASGFCDKLMRRVEKPDPDQRAVYARLRGELAKRDHEGSATPSKRASLSFLDQLARLHEVYPKGFADPKWIAETRGDGAEVRSARHRTSMIRDAQEKLAHDSLNTLVRAHHADEIWEQVIAVLRHTDLVPHAQLKLKTTDPEQERTLGLAVRELLYGKPTFATRFEHFLEAFEAAFGDLPPWELATAISAVVHPTEHVSVEPNVLRKQLKATSARRPIPALPSSAGYASCLAIARLVANKLAEQGEIPRDLLEVRDFMTFTLKRPQKARTTA